MSQRNPMNDRYTSEGKKGQTRKSAAKAKPKTKAAASVYLESRELTPQQKKQKQKAARKSERNEQAEFERETYAVPTPEYKKLRRLWFVMIGVGVVLLAIALFLQFQVPDSGAISMTFIILAYVAVIGAFIFDRVKINKLRKAYREEIRNDRSKESRAEKKAREREAAEAAKKASEAAEVIEKNPSASSKLAGLFKKKETPVQEPNDEASEEKTASDKQA